MNFFTGVYKMNQNLAVVRISRHVRKMLKIRSASINVPMVDLANLFILEGLALKNDHIQLLLATQESQPIPEVDEDDEEHHHEQENL